MKNGRDSCKYFQAKKKKPIDPETTQDRKEIANSKLVLLLYGY